MRSSCQFMRNSAFILLFISFSIFACPKAYSQTSINTPYSRFGLGELNFNQNTKNFGMGGVSLAFRDAASVNNSNPASYTAFDSLSFVVEASVAANFYQQQTLSQKQFSNNGAINGLTFGFPITRWWGASIGILPFSNIGYTIANEEIVDPFGEVKYVYNGKGGLNQCYVGMAFKPFKGLSVGANVSYIFGNISHSSLVYSDSSAFYVTDIINSMAISGLAVNGGVQYSISLANNHYLNIGGIFGAQSNLNASRSQTALSYLLTTSTSVDTLQWVTNESGNISIPPYYGGGVSFGKNGKWNAGLDFKLQDWGAFKMYERVDSLNSSLQMAAGFSFIPSTYMLAKGLSRWEYRFGFRYHQTYLNINNTPVNEIGMSFGIGIPLRKTKSGFNLGFEYARRGTTDNNLIQEDLYRIKVGVNIQERWFVKRKFN